MEVSVIMPSANIAMEKLYLYRRWDRDMQGRPEACSGRVTAQGPQFPGTHKKVSRSIYSYLSGLLVAFGPMKLARPTPTHN
jgi:hypothetical protein